MTTRILSRLTNKLDDESGLCVEILKGKWDMHKNPSEVEVGYLITDIHPRGKDRLFRNQSGHILSTNGEYLQIGTDNTIEVLDWEAFRADSEYKTIPECLLPRFQAFNEWAPVPHDARKYVRENCDAFLAD